MNCWEHYFQPDKVIHSWILRKYCFPLHYLLLSMPKDKCWIWWVKVMQSDPGGMVRTVLLLWSLLEIWQSGLSSCCRPVFVYWGSVLIKRPEKNFFSICDKICHQHIRDDDKSYKGRICVAMMDIIQ